MEKLSRSLKSAITTALQRNKSILLLGSRQVGKTTLLMELSIDRTITLARPAIRQQYEQNIETYSQEIESFAEKIGKNH